MFFSSRCLLWYIYEDVFLVVGDLKKKKLLYVSIRELFKLDNHQTN